jgi:hypothetical protein
MLSDNGNDEKEQKEKEKKIDEIGRVLKLDVVRLKDCKHPSDITKTCRNIVKVLYPNVKTRAKTRLSSMPSKTVKTIRGECRMRDRNFIINFECFQ